MTMMKLRMMTYKRVMERRNMMMKGLGWRIWLRLKWRNEAQEENDEEEEDGEQPDLWLCGPVGLPPLSANKA
jgi:hypothetical protein